MPRQPSFTRLDKTGEHAYRVRQVLLDEADDNDWYVDGIVDLTVRQANDEPLVELVGIRS